MHRSPPPGPRARVETVRDAHSLYAEVLGELGIVGFVLLLTTLLTILVGVARRIAGAERASVRDDLRRDLRVGRRGRLRLALGDAGGTMWVFALGGAAIAGARDRTPATRFLGMLPRSVIAVACSRCWCSSRCGCVISDGRLQSARTAYQERKLPGGSDLRPAVTGRAGQPSRAAPVRRGMRAHRRRRRRPRSPVCAPRSRLDPDNWRAHYSLAIAKARAGQDPRAEIRRARQLNPLEPLVLQAARILKPKNTPRQWRNAARRSALTYLAPPL